MRIVLIEPSAADRYWLRMMLQETGIEYSLQEFPSTLAAMSELESALVGPFDAVIINVVLPFLEVGDAVARLRKLPEFARAKCAITVLDEHDFDRVPAGCAALIKPVSSEALTAFLLNS